jgi:fermentation-respiration switch protein FrsA (DUF1100 family)
MAKLAVCIYLGLAIVIYFLQTWMIFPGAATQGKPQAQVRPTGTQQLIDLTTAAGDKTVLLFAPALTPGGLPHPDAAHRPTLIYFYGNAMTISACYEELYQFRRLGANVAIPEFVGYGLASGKPSEKTLYATADAAYEHLLTRSDVDPNQIIPVGWSLGAAAAIDLASRKPVAALATFSAFTSMRDMGRHVLPWFPTSLLLRHRFENQRKLRGITCPVFLAHGTQDSLIPFTMHGQLAAAAANAPLTLVLVAGGDHNDIFQQGGVTLMRQFGTFIESVHDAAQPSGTAQRTSQNRPTITSP